ncbi:MAG TPA: phosphatidate cytidylyltransferase [Methylomirabilota bacterium]|nr:phosphatidate cytidylyltransferase [Methylomirabilota bacterium]
MATAVSAEVLAGAVRVPAVLKRLLSAVVLLPVFVLIVVKAPAFLFNLLVVVFCARALWELLRMLEQGGHPVQRRLGLVVGVALTASFGASRMLEPLLLPALVLTLGAGAILAAPIWQQGAPSVQSAAGTLLAVIYVGWLLGYGILLHHTSPRGDELILFLVGVTWVGETAAYVVGSTLGRHRLAPVVSPRKTVEGSIAQVVASLATGAALGAWLLPGCRLASVVAAGGLLGVVGQVGDLTESVIKRSVGVKDAAALIPGHGGVLDRIDSLLFNLPAFYYVSLWAGCT